jgi:heme A synthase
MLTIHGTLGEALVLVYLVIAILAAVMANRGGLPAWVTGIGHGLLTVQVLIGIFLLIRNPSAVPWHHILFGLLTIPALGLMFPLRKRLGPTKGVIIGAVVLIILITAAVFTGLNR